jgi:hypothetical protein
MMVAMAIASRDDRLRRVDEKPHAISPIVIRGALEGSANTGLRKAMAGIRGGRGTGG